MHCDVNTSSLLNRIGMLDAGMLDADNDCVDAGDDEFGSSAIMCFPSVHLAFCNFFWRV